VQTPTKENSKFIELQTIKVQTKYRTKLIGTQGEISRSKRKQKNTVN